MQVIEQFSCFKRRSHNYSVPVGLATIGTYIVTRIGILRRDLTPWDIPVETINKMDAITGLFRHHLMMTEL